MSRSGYSEDYDDNWSLIQWRGAVASALTGKRGKTFLLEMKAALEALPEKRLIKNDFIHEGEVCALGSVAQARGVDLSDIDPEDEYSCHRQIAKRLDIPYTLAAEIMYMNDEGLSDRYDYEKHHYIERPPEQRYTFVMNWIDEQLARRRTPRKPHKHRAKKS